MKTSFTVVGDATKVLNPLQIDPKKLNERVGRAVMSSIKRHLSERDKTHPNKLGGKRTHFYRDAANHTTYHSVSNNEGEVVIDKIGLRQRLLGGEIRAKNAKYLTIPAIAQAYARPAGSFHNLRFVQFGKGADAPKALVETQSGAVDSGTGKKVAGRKKFQKQTGQKNRVFYWLKESVFQDGDPTVLPGGKAGYWSSEELQQVGVEAANGYFATLKQKYFQD